MYPEMIYSYFDTNADVGRISEGVFCTDTRDISHVFLFIVRICLYIHTKCFYYLATVQSQVHRVDFRTRRESFIRFSRTARNKNPNA